MSGAGEGQDLGVPAASGLGERGMLLVPLVLAAISGFAVGVMMQGAVVLSLSLALVGAASGFIGWWMRGAC